MQPILLLLPFIFPLSLSLALPATSPAERKPFKSALTITSARRQRIQTFVDDDDLSTNKTLTAAALPSWAGTTIVSGASTHDQVYAAVSTMYNHYRNPKTKQFNGIGWWQSANVYNAMINLDQFQGIKAFQGNVLADLQALIKIGPEGKGVGLRNVYNDDTLWWALACLDAYETYGSAATACRDEAYNLWDWVRDTSFITSTGGTSPPNWGGIQRTHIISNQCKLESGVLWTTYAGETYVNSITTGLFMDVSGQLYNKGATAENYGQYAIRSLKWLQEHTVDMKLQLVLQDGVDMTTCKLNGGSYTYNTGIYIGALLNLYTLTGNSIYLTEAETAGFLSTETAVWTDTATGKITESHPNDGKNNDGIGFRGILIRNLTRLYKRTNNADLKKQLRGFINVNWNNLYLNARKTSGVPGGEAWFDSDWWGPYRGDTAWGMMGALDLLVAGFIVNK